jgi:predicted PurR-regulated permease PerM
VLTQRPLRGLRLLSQIEAALRARARNREAPPAEAPAEVVAEAAEAIEEVERRREGDLGTVARRSAVATVVGLAIVAAALALWKIRLVVALLFLAFTIAAAMRPSVEALNRRGLPRSVGVAVHYVALLGLVALFLWLVVPRAIDQVQGALGEQHTLGQAASRATGLRHDILTALDRQLRNLPSGSELIHPAVEYGRQAFEIFIGIFFTFASAAYWIFERDRAIDLFSSLVPRPKRKKLRDTWELIDLKLGAFVRGQAVFVVIVGVVLSLAFWALGMPYWLLVGTFAGIVEVVPVIGPIAAGAVAILVGLASSFHVALFAGIAVLAVRLLEDYLLVPRVLGHSVGLSPLVVLVSISTVGILFGGFAVILAIPIASVLVTLLDVLLRKRDPAEEEVPKVIFPAKDAE